VATVISHHVKQTVIQLDLSLTAQKDLLAIVHVALVTAIQVATVVVLSAQVAVVQVVTATLGTVQMQACRTVVLVTLPHSVKNLSHVMVQVLHVARVTLIAVVTVQMQIVVTTVY
jgi:hypothetical protein